MCIVFFESHPENQCEHYVLHYHCAHEGCDGLFESHHKFLLETTATECSVCLKQDGVMSESNLEVRYYPPVEHFAICYVPLKGWERVEEDADKGKMGDSAYEGQPTSDGRKGGSKGKEDDYSLDKSLSDVDSVTSYWRKDSRDDLEASHKPQELSKSQDSSKSHALPHRPSDTPSKPQGSSKLQHTSKPQGSTKSQDKTRRPPQILNFLAEAELEEASRTTPHFRGPLNPHREVHESSARQESSVEQDSPNTTWHRTLVHQQLASLLHHLAHTQQHSQQHPRQHPRQGPQLAYGYHAEKQPQIFHGNTSHQHAGHQYVAPQRSGYYWEGPQRYSNRILPGLCQWFTPEPGRGFDPSTFEALRKAMDRNDSQ